MSADISHEKAEYDIIQGVVLFFLFKAYFCCYFGYNVTYEVIFLEAYDKLVKPISEVNYLVAPNVARYRLIIRYFFREYEKIHYWLHSEDVYRMMKEVEGYEEYTNDQCIQDLQSLVEWGNLIADQDSRKVKTIKDFMNRQYRYQLSEYSVEIERMTLRLEKMNIEGSSLEPTLLERIYEHLKKIQNIKDKDNSDIHDWLNELMNDFTRLNQNYQDYIKTLNSARAEELMKTEAFLLFKDKLINYLRTFVIAMQETGTKISLELENIAMEEMKPLFIAATDYELSIPRIDVELNRDEILDNYQGKWQSLYIWFVGENEESEMDRLNNITNEIIRKITHYARQIAEMNNRSNNRKEQYEHMADIFMKCEDINEAHCLSAYVFGVEDCLHLSQIQPRMSEDIQQGVYQDHPSSLSFEPHSRIVRKKSVRLPSTDHSLEKHIQQLELQEENRKKQETLQKLIVDHKIIFAQLAVIDAPTRKTLLNWLSKGLLDSDHIGKTEDGNTYYIDDSHSQNQCLLKCEDGNFMMPAFEIVFKEDSYE